MPYGITGGPATFQSTMNNILAPYLKNFVLVFIDDILIYSHSWTDHLQHIEAIFQTLQDHVKTSKCVFAKSKLLYLGHVISATGVSTNL